MPEKGIYDELPDGVVVADAEGRIVVVNPAAERILGRTADETVGHDYRDVLPLVDAQGNNWWDCTRPYDGLPTRTRSTAQSVSLCSISQPSRNFAQSKLGSNAASSRFRSA